MRCPAHRSGCHPGRLDRRRSTEEGRVQFRAVSASHDPRRGLRSGQPPQRAASPTSVLRPRAAVMNLRLEATISLLHPRFRPLRSSSCQVSPPCSIDAALPVEPSSVARSVRQVGARSDAPSGHLDVLPTPMPSCSVVASTDATGVAGLEGLAGRADGRCSQRARSQAACRLVMASIAVSGSTQPLPRTHIGMSSRSTGRATHSTVSRVRHMIHVSSFSPPCSR